MNYFNEDYEKKLIEAFDAFVNDRTYDFSFVRPEIYSSWQRSKEFSIEYDKPVRFKKLDDKSTKKLIKDNSLFI